MAGFRFAAWLFCFCFLSVDFALAAGDQQAKTQNITLSSFEKLEAGRWQVVLPLSRVANYSVFSLRGADRRHRIVIDILDERTIAAACSVSGGPILGCRTGRAGGDRARFVLDVSAEMKVESASLEARRKSKGRFLLKVIFARTDRELLQSEKNALKKVKPVRLVNRMQDRVIIIDPGHGGSDIGASFGGVDEKDLMLTFARELRDEISAQKGFSAFLTRNKDEFVSLQDRVLLARRHRADALISLHADWNADPQVRGLAVYFLSNNSANKYARIFIESKNPRIIDGEEWNAALSSAHDILFDLTQRESRGKSIALGRSILKHARFSMPILDQPHRFADFHVLSAPDLPAILIEIGFLSNRDDMSNLAQKAWRKKLSHQFIGGLRDYFKQVRQAGF